MKVLFYKIDFFIFKILTNYIKYIFFKSHKESLNPVSVIGQLSTYLDANLYFHRKTIPMAMRYNSRPKLQGNDLKLHVPNLETDNHDLDTIISDTNLVLFSYSLIYNQIWAHRMGVDPESTRTGWSRDKSQDNLAVMGPNRTTTGSLCRVLQCLHKARPLG